MPTTCVCDLVKSKMKKITKLCRNKQNPTLHYLIIHKKLYGGIGGIEQENARQI